jgi:hypothetical protein
LAAFEVITEVQKTPIVKLDRNCAVFCADCETISNSPHDACTVCGSRSLINLFRMLGGTVWSQKPQSAEDHAKTANPTITFAS